MADAAALERELSMAELVSRVLDRGAVISGEVVISVAGIDLIYVGLQLMVSSVETIGPVATGLAAALPPAAKPSD